MVLVASDTTKVMATRSIIESTTAATATTTIKVVWMSKS